MDKQGLATNRPPLFTGDNYAYWSVRMKCHLMDLGYKVWSTVETEYKVPDDVPINEGELELYEANAKALNAILSGLTESILVKVMQCKTSKHAWEKLKFVYEGAPKVKESKLHTYKRQFENLKMKEEEKIAEYLLRVDEIVNSIRDIGGEIKDKYVVDKVLITLPMKYDSKVPSLEGRDDLKIMTIDEIHGIFTAYEMRT